MKNLEMEIATIKLSYSDLLDILDDYRLNNWDNQPCNIDAYAKYVWRKYQDKIGDNFDVAKMLDRV